MTTKDEDGGLGGPFERIAEQAIQKAEHVRCSSDSFKRGLVTIWHAINERLEMEGVDPRDPKYL